MAKRGAYNIEKMKKSKTTYASTQRMMQQPNPSEGDSSTPASIKAMKPRSDETPEKSLFSARRSLDFNFRMKSLNRLVNTRYGIRGICRTFNKVVGNL